MGEAKNDAPGKLPGAGHVAFSEHEMLLKKSAERQEISKRMTELERLAQRNPRQARKSPKAKAGPAAKPAESAPDWLLGARRLGEPADLRRAATGKATSQNSKSLTAAEGEDEVGQKQTYLDSGVFPTAGIALSGGGIRSAAFCTGVIQAFGVHRCFGVFDYISSVSGGGYIASNVSLNMHHSGELVLLGPKGEKKDSAAMEVIRHNADYLKMNEIPNVLLNAGIYLRGFVANLFSVLSLLLFLAAITLLANQTYKSLGQPDFLGFEFSEVRGACTLGSYHLGGCVSTVLSNLGVMPITLVILSILLFGNLVWALRVSAGTAEGGGIRTPWRWFPIILLPLFMVVAWLEFQPSAVQNMFAKPYVQGPPVTACAANELQTSCTDGKGGLLPVGSNCPQSNLVMRCKPKEVAAASGLAGSTGAAIANLFNWLKVLAAPLLAIVPFFSNQLSELFKQEEVKSTWQSLLKRSFSRMVVLATGIAFMLLLWLCYLYLVYWGVNTHGMAFEEHLAVPSAVTSVLGWWHPSPAGLLYLYASLVLVFCSIVMSANGNSLHRLYRDRLGNAFCFVMNKDGPVAADKVKLSTLENNRPIHLINAAVNLQNSRSVKSRGRKADFFLFSPRWIGSDATGYAETTAMENLPRNLGEDIDVATAVAISGAAVSSNMGNQSMKPIAPLLVFLNLRLGHWFPNPRLTQDMNALRPNVLYPVYEALGLLHENRDRVYLTDGGHIENLGLYELLRRRCRLIVVVDAEADAAMQFTSFVKLQQFARIDLGVRIELPWSEIAATTKAAMTGKVGAKSGPHCAVGTISYDNGGTGVLVYIKASVTGDENDYVREYNRRNETFPHESTGDQFFSEEQFEVYRALGFHAVDSTLSGDAVVQSSKGIEKLTDPAASGNGVQQVAMLLGLKQKPHVKPVDVPLVHKIKIVR